MSIINEENQYNEIDNNSNFNEEEKIMFTYEALKLLIVDEKEIVSLLQNGEFDELVLLPFKINMTGSEPFNTFMLLNDISKDMSKNELSFISIINNVIDHENKISDVSMFQHFINFIKCYLFSLLQLKDFVTFDVNCHFKGVYLYDKKMYLMIDLTKVEIMINLIYKTTHFCFVLIDEIVNRRHFANISINYDVSKYFLDNSEFMFLKNDKNEQIEIPTVVYTGIHDKLLYFRFVFGNIKMDSNSILGSNYYFTNFKHAIRQGGWSKYYNNEYRDGIEITDSNGKYIKGGIIRYAIFLGNYLIKENLLNDNIDNSEIKQTRLKNEDLDYNYEKLTLRISDHDSLWSQNYDSVILSNIELDNGEFLKDTPMYVIKDFEKQIPLSYHYINKSLLGDTFNEADNYEIL